MKMKILALLVIFLPLTGTYALGQTAYDKATFDDAEYFFVQEDYTEAISSYLKLYKKNFKNNPNINYKIGVCYLNIAGQKEKSIPFLEYAALNITNNYKEGSIKETKAPIDVLLFLGNAYRINMQYEKAIEAYNKFLALTSNPKELQMEKEWARNQIEACQRAKAATNSIVRIKISSLGKPINTKEDNINPAISANEKRMVYITKQKFYYALMFSEKNKSNKWGLPLNITGNIMSDGNQFPLYLSPDGNTLLLNYIDGENSDIYMAKFEKKKWQPSQPLSKAINSRYWESNACLSPGGDTIFFSSNRPESVGGLDIFYSIKTSTGEWGPAVNIGNTINTKLNEDCPYLSYSGDTLYFASQGHESMGGFDIFYSVKDSNGNWSAPINIGYPVNTTDDDLFFIPVANSYTAYQSRYLKTGGMGNFDICKIEFFNHGRPFPFTIKGNVNYLLQISKAENYNILLTNDSGKVISDTIKANADGSFEFSKAADTYRVLFIKDTSKVISNRFVIPENYPSDTYTLTTEIIQDKIAYSSFINSIEEPNKPILIRNILFSFNDVKINDDDKKEIVTIANMLKKYPEMQIRLIGHTDALGSEEYNQKLSEKRAGVVKNVLLALKVDEKQIITEGRSLNEPIAINANTDGSDNPVGRAFNRRVEFELVNCPDARLKIDPIKVPAELKAQK